MTHQIEMLDAVMVDNAETGELDLVHLACAGDRERRDGPPVTVSWEAKSAPPTCTACGKPFESGMMHTPATGKIIRRLDQDEDEGDPPGSTITKH